MGSVIVTWKGTCPRRKVQDELLSYLTVLSERNEALISGNSAKRPEFVEMLSRQRSEGLPVMPNVRRIDRDISGRILISTDIAVNHETLVAEADRLEIPHEKGGPRHSRHSLFRLKRLSVRGMDFRLFDPRGLYPGEDRIGFFFLESREAPFLDSRLAVVHDREWCSLSGLEPVRSADWFVQCPFIHLRYYMESWVDILLAWVKFFFMPDLYYCRYDEFSGYGKLSEEFAGLRHKLGEAAGKNQSFETILGAFEDEADRWVRDMKKW